jgi:hypothetical protein
LLRQSDWILRSGQLALPDLPPAKKDSRSKNALSFNARAQIARVVGVDLVAVMGLSAVTVQTIISEIGTDMELFPTVKHFCSWLGLAPHNDKSGGKVLRSRTMKVRNRANQAFRQAAQSVAQSDSSFGAYYRAMRTRLGPKQAIVATAHKIARTVYHLLKTHEHDIDPGTHPPHLRAVPAPDHHGAAPRFGQGMSSGVPSVITFLCVLVIPFFYGIYLTFTS